MGKRKKILSDEQEQILKLERALINNYKRFERLVVAIQRDRELSEKFKFWCLGDELKSSYADMSDAVFIDTKSFSKEVAKQEAFYYCVKMSQVFDFISENKLKGYEEVVRDWIKKGLIEKDAGNEMIRKRREQYFKDEKPKDDARAFMHAVIRFGASEVQHIYNLAGRDFDAALKNCRMFHPSFLRNGSILLEDYTIDAGSEARKGETGNDGEDSADGADRD